MNICLTVNSSPWSPFKGGGQIAVHYLATHLAKNKCKVWVIYTGSSQNKIPPSLNYNAIFAKHFNVATLNLNTFSVAFQFFKLSRKFRMDIIHGNGEEAFFIPYLAKLASSKFVLTSHSPFMPQTGIFRALRRPIQTLKKLNFYLLRSAALKSDCLITFSDFSKSLVKNGLGNEFRKPINIIPPGIDPSWFNAKMSNNKNFSDLLYFGRIEHEKGIDILLKAFTKLLADFPSLKLHLIGEGNYLETSKKLCNESGLEKNVVFHGWKEKHEIQKMMSACDLCVLPSRIESFGLTIAEAMAGGIPVISSNVGAIPEILKDRESGMLVQSENVEALKNAMTYALKNPAEIKKWATAAKKRVESNYSWGLAVSEHLKIYKKLIPRSGFNSSQLTAIPYFFLLF